LGPQGSRLINAPPPAVGQQVAEAYWLCVVAPATLSAG
jgi:hypothetical protein